MGTLPINVKHVPPQVTARPALAPQLASLVTMIIICSTALAELLAILATTLTPAVGLAKLAAITA